MTSGWPRNPETAGAISRAVRSGVPPAGTDTITRTGFSGQAFAARAGDAASASAIAAMT
jgi:hypothetical protein